MNIFREGGAPDMLNNKQSDIEHKLNQLRAVTTSDFAAIALWEHRENRIRWKFASGSRNERYKEIALKPGRGLAGMVIRLGRPIIVDVTLPDLERVRQNYSIMLVEHLWNAVAVPVIVNDETQGVLLVGNRNQAVPLKFDTLLIASWANSFVPMLEEPPVTKPIP